MQYNASTPEKYLNTIEDDWRKEKLLLLREIILQADPDLKEGIEYKMLCYGDDDKRAIHLNAQKNYVGLYIGSIERVDPDGELLKGIDVGKGCVRIKKTNDVEERRFHELIERVIGNWKKGRDK